MTLLTEVEAGQRLGGITPKTLRTWRSLRKGPRYIKVGWRVRYTAEAIDQFLTDRTVTPGEAKRRRRRRAA